MCIVIDTNTFSSVFNVSSKDHAQFECLLEWILKRNGKIVYGGSKYLSELKKTEKYMKIFKLLDDNRKVVRVNDDAVNNVEIRLKESIHGTFNDHHLIAIIIESNCRLICTHDSKAIPYLTDKNNYPTGVKKPKIFKGKQHNRLLCNENIAPICRKCGNDK